MIQKQFLTIEMTHNGRTGDLDEQLSTLALLFDDGLGTPLSSVEVNALITQLDIYLDDGSGVFEISSDTLVTTIDTLSLTDGMQIVPFTNGDANVQVAYGSPKTFHVVATASAGASSQSPNQFRITHITDGATTSTGKYWDYDIPLTLAYEPDVASATVPVLASSMPVITLEGNNPDEVQCGSGSYVEPGFSAYDLEDGDLTASVTADSPSNVDTTIPGTYVLNYSVTDSTSNTTTDQRTVNVVDTAIPVLSLLGNNPEIVECGAVYSDAGATATDACDGDLTASIMMDDSTVDTSVVGSYTVTFDVSDAASNAATQVVRMVNVADSTAPVISLTGSTPVMVECGTSYTDAGATAIDACDGNLTGSIITVNPVDINATGAYSVTYDVTDAALNAATQVVRTVNVQDTTVPVITLLGNNPETVVMDSGTYSDAGATATDTCAGDISASISVTGAVDTDTSGTYLLDYDVVDGSGNAAATVTRAVVIKDMNPVILSGPYVTDITDTTAVVVWQTDKMTTSEVLYGLIDPPGTPESVAGYRTEHAVPLNGLTPDTVYYVQVTTTDEGGARSDGKRPNQLPYLAYA